MEGVLKHKAAAIVQWKEGWCGVSFGLKQKEITELTLVADKSLAELGKMFEESGYGIGLENGAAYLFNLSFPFSDKHKIRLVLANELEERVPVAMDDMVVDFVESGNERILAGAMARSSSNGSAPNKHVRITTIQGLAVLYALKWFDRVRHRDFVFLHMNGNAVLVMAFKDDSLYYLRQFFHSHQSGSLHDAFAQITADREFAPRSYLMVADNEEGPEVKEYLERTFQIDVETPRLRETLGSGDAPDWLWAAVGTALLSLKPKGQLDFTGAKRQYTFLSTKAGFYLSAGLASLGLLTYGLLYADYYLKQRTYQFLATEPGRIYRLSFPKSPPVRDPARMFRDKIHALEQAPDTASSTARTPLAVLDEISRSIAPDIDVKVSEFASDEKEFTISGTTVSFASIEKIKDSIERISGVSQVEMQSLDLAANKQVKFRLRGRL
jgi:hypothetical protein